MNPFGYEGAYGSARQRVFSALWDNPEYVALHAAKGAAWRVYFDSGECDGGPLGAAFDHICERIAEIEDAALAAAGLS